MRNCRCVKAEKFGRREALATLNLGCSPSSQILLYPSHLRTLESIPLLFGSKWRRPSSPLLFSNSTQEKLKYIFPVQLQAYSGVEPMQHWILKFLSPQTLGLRLEGTSGQTGSSSLLILITCLKVLWLLHLGSIWLCAREWVYLHLLLCFTWCQFGTQRLLSLLSWNLPPITYLKETQLCSFCSSTSSSKDPTLTSLILPLHSLETHLSFLLPLTQICSPSPAT